MKIILILLLLFFFNFGCAKKEEHGEDASSTSSSNDISIYFIYPNDQVMPPDNYKSAAGIIANSIGELLPEMITKIVRRTSSEPYIYTLEYASIRVVT